MKVHTAHTDLLNKAVDLMKNGQVAEYIRTLIHLHELKHASRTISAEQNLSA
jgi:hypothetical protein